MPPSPSSSSPTPEATADERLDRLRSLVAENDDDSRWLILTHDNPDPDSIMAATLLGRLLYRGFGQKVTLGHGGIIGRAENRELVRVIGVKLSHLRHLSLKRYGRFALVDAQPGTGNSSLPDGLVPDLVFDHHPLRKTTEKVPFVDVRTEYGATATLLAEYLEAADVPLTRALATGLVYALRSETQDFGREYAAPDKALYDRVLPRADRRALARIQTARLPLSYFRSLHQALENLETVDTLIVSHLGEVEQPDIVPEVADLLLRLEGKTWSLATGLFGERVYLSIRTTNPRADAGHLMRRLVGRQGKGGGHGMMAGGWVAAGNAPNGDPRALQERMAKKLAKALRKKPEKLAPVEMLGAEEGTE